jgi:hypothetical protein
MGLYGLVGIIVLMFAAIVATKEPEVNSGFAKAARKKRGGGYISRRPEGSLSAAASSLPR